VVLRLLVLHTAVEALFPCELQNSVISKPNENTCHLILVHDLLPVAVRTPRMYSVWGTPAELSVSSGRSKCPPGLIIALKAVQSHHECNQGKTDTEQSGHRTDYSGRTLAQVVTYVNFMSQTPISRDLSFCTSVNRMISNAIVWNQT
jgi:hypothetical protein